MKMKRAQPWTVFITHGAMSPVKHFAINLGAPADMKDTGEKFGLVIQIPEPNIFKIISQIMA
jgi:hypothetical protein